MAMAPGFFFFFLSIMGGGMLIQWNFCSLSDLGRIIVLFLPARRRHFNNAYYCAL